jgi:hypothetical protein
MARFSNIIQAAAAVFGYEGGYVRESDGPHYTVRVSDGPDRQEDVTVSVIGSGGLEPANHFGNEQWTAADWDAMNW